MTALRSVSVTVLQGSERTPSETNAAKLVELMGGTVAFVRLPEGEAVTNIGETIPQGAAIVVRAGALAAALMPERNGFPDRLASLMSIAGYCFVFGFEADRGCDRLLQELTRGRLRGVGKLAAHTERLAVTVEHGDICRQLSGLEFDADIRDSESVFLEGATDSADNPALIRIAGKAHLLRISYRDTPLMLLASSEIVDLDDSPQGRAPMAGLFSRLAPLLMFLRQIGGATLWHNESPRACLILDDPLLKPRYGFLEFERLLALMQEESFSTSIAFIPWNYRRSDKRVTELFRRFPAHLSMSIHGCDHTGAEFASTDVPFLRGQAARGLQWMTKHRELTGIGFDDVMVFPQGHFSTVAMEVLQSCGYLAAVNSTGHPVDAQASHLRLRDLLDVAITKFGQLPLFIRHYPDDVVGLAVDLFLGKPALLVEHHGYFRDGYESLAGIVRTLKRMEPRLEWTNLSTICSRANLIKELDSGEVCVRFYARRFELRNDTNQSQRYVLQYQQRGKSPLSVKVDDVLVEKPEVDGTVARVTLRAGEVVKVEVCHEHESVAALARRPITWRAKVSIRRALSEFRDCHLDKHPFLKDMASRVRKQLIGST